MNHRSQDFTRATLRWTVLLAVVICFFFVVNSRPAFAAPTVQESQEQTLLVHFDANATSEMREALITQMGGEMVAWMPQINVAEIRLSVQDSAVIASLAGGIVTHAESDMVVTATYMPNDPDFSDETMSYGFQQIQAFDAWDVVKGSPEIIIAVIDSGVKRDHPEFAGRIVAGFDFVHNDDQPDDDSGHGTHVAGLIAAGLDNGAGVAGVCPNCLLMPVKVLNENNLGSWSQLAQGILFAVDHGARVINLSLGASISSETLASAVRYAIERGVVVVAAAGNYASDAPFYPAAFDGVLAIGATTQDGTLWDRSDYGSYIDLVAPGELIYSTYNDLNNIFRGYTYMSGTSMATSFVSGVAGLLLSIAPTLTADEVADAMIFGADDLGASGWDAEYGHGRLNAMGALTSPIPGLVKALGEEVFPQQKVTLFLPALSNH